MTAGFMFGARASVLSATLLGLVAACGQIDDERIDTGNKDAQGATNNGTKTDSTFSNYIDSPYKTSAITAASPLPTEPATPRTGLQSDPQFVSFVVLSDWIDWEIVSTVELTNFGPGTVTLRNARIENRPEQTFGDGARHFALSAFTGDVVLGPGQSVDLRVQFFADTNDSAHAILVVDSPSLPGGRFEVGLYGKVISL